MIELLKVRGFAAFVAVAFINAFVDLGHKIIIQNTLFKSYDGNEQILLTAVVNGLILLPFIMLFTPAGFVSDKYPKYRVMRLSACAAILVTLAITACYYLGWFVPAFALTFVLALQSAFYSPAKYAYIRELVGSDNLGEANGWVQAATMVAILSGILVFSLLFELRLAGVEGAGPAELMRGIAPLGWFLVAGACFETWLAYRLPAKGRTDSALRFDWRAYRRGRTLTRNLAHLVRIRPIWLSILGLALFWSLSQVMLAVFPAFAKSQLGELNTFRIQGAMALAGIGIMAGSLLAGRLSRHHINLGLIPLGAGGVALALLLLPGAGDLGRAGLLFLLVGFCGALMVIPLNALIQFNAERGESGRVLAGNNFIQNIAMLAFLGLTVFSAYRGVPGVTLLYALATVALLLALATVLLLPEALIRLLLTAVLRRKYRLEVLGFEHLQEEGRGMLLLGNHISWLDWGILQLACPRHIHFVMERSIYQRWYLRWFLDRFGVIPISSRHSREALARIGELLQAGKVVCLFPEGMISHTGQLGRFRNGFERACVAVTEDSGATIVPFYLRGLWGSRFSRSGRRLRAGRRFGLRRDLVVAFGAPIPINSDASTVKQRVSELSIHAWNRYVEQLETVPRAFVRSARQGPSAWILRDARGEALGYRELLAACAQLARRLRGLEGANLGLMVPTSSQGVLANMAALMAGKTLVNLSPDATGQELRAMCERAGVRSLLATRDALGRLDAAGVQLPAQCRVLRLEDLAPPPGTAAPLGLRLACRLIPLALLQRWLCHDRGLDATAAIVFDAGPQGVPRGVMLSHRNLIANIRQIGEVLNVRENDVWVATQPLSQATGLTVTCLMPLVEGVPVICHPDQEGADPVALGKTVARRRATLLCTSERRLRQYLAQPRLHPLMFQSLRSVIVGGESLDPALARDFEARFRVPVLAGYGCTETTPVASVNLPDYLDTQWWTLQEGTRPGSLGLPLPGTTFRIVDPVSLEERPPQVPGEVVIGGAQIMQGYLGEPGATARAVIERDGLRWFRTGVRGTLDQDGFLWLRQGPGNAGTPATGASGTEDVASGTGRSALKQQ
ncbi:acyl-[ACP]--phospholipid O-acyltransferase [Marinobacterium nitratireducens]|uniref:Acyl-[ACP]--phospholipid O-acyltransferase n=1 Tax=Marinobacterium nitratireducens TaxID=518897 RepID=A0A917ZBG5_9GAMM|nr:MFS transporter [Marinobacterium nitratireducens]GGO79429.1 acyl-[ACP]--phospholipid O-acyltransferase [Marinobacterium nitratireducens]